MKAVELGPVAAGERTQPASDLFLIFAGANIVATTLVTGASLVPAFSTKAALALIAVGSVAGAALVAALVPVGPLLGVPSVIAARAALGRTGAAALALLLYVTNFAWIALNNVIAASACAQVAGGQAAVRPGRSRSVWPPPRSSPWDRERWAGRTAWRCRSWEWWASCWWSAASACRPASGRLVGTAA